MLIRKKSPPTTNFASAVFTVFGTTELLEKIFCHLSDLDAASWTQLFVVQRVSRRFHSVIRSSPTLRRAMYLEHPKPQSVRSNPELSTVLNSYRAFFAAIQRVLFPFWCHLRPSNGPEALILALNISLFWSEEMPGVMVGKPPGRLDGSKAIEQSDSWRKLIVPQHADHQLELQCCGYPVQDSFVDGITLGELADKAIDAGKGHLGRIQPVTYYG